MSGRSIPHAALTLPSEPGLQVKGKAESVTASRVVGLGTRRSRLKLEGGRTLSQFVGRERELAVLQGVLAEVEAGRGQIVGVSGEPGVGKSRLLYEFRLSVSRFLGKSSFSGENWTWCRSGDSNPDTLAGTRP